MTKCVKNSICDETQIAMKLETQIVMKLKNSFGDKTQKLKLWQNSKTQIVTKLKLWQNPNCDQTRVVRKKSKTQMWQNSDSDSSDQKKYITLHLKKITKTQRATGPALTSVKAEKHVILPSTLNFAVRRGKLRIYTLQYPPEVCPFWRL